MGQQFLGVGDGESRLSGKHGEETEIFVRDTLAVEEVIDHDKAEDLLSCHYWSGGEFRHLQLPRDLRLRRGDFTDSAAEGGAGEDTCGQGPGLAVHGNAYALDERIEPGAGGLVVGIHFYLPGQAEAGVRSEGVPYRAGILRSVGADAEHALKKISLLVEKKEGGPVESQAGFGGGAGENHLENAIDLEGAAQSVVGLLQYPELLETLLPLLDEPGRLEVEYDVHGAESDLAGDGLEESGALGKKAPLERQVAKAGDWKVERERADAAAFAAQGKTEEGEVLAGGRRLFGEDSEAGQSSFGP
jgi:hypothetical protein